MCLIFGSAVNDASMQWTIKGGFRDPSILFLWHFSVDIHEKSLFPKFQLIPILRLRVMHDYVYYTAP